jgi:hypothetical protein
MALCWPNYARWPGRVVTWKADRAARSHVRSASTFKTPGLTDVCAETDCSRLLRSREISNLTDVPEPGKAKALLLSLTSRREK